MERLLYWLDTQIRAVRRMAISSSDPKLYSYWVGRLDSLEDLSKLVKQEIWSGNTQKTTP